MRTGRFAGPLSLREKDSMRADFSGFALTPAPSHQEKEKCGAHYLCGRLGNSSLDPFNPFKHRSTVGAMRELAGSGYCLLWSVLWSAPLDSFEQASAHLLPLCCIAHRRNLSISLFCIPGSLLPCCASSTLIERAHHVEE